MFEDLTYEVILNRMLARVPSTMDKREGSIIYDALAPCAVELQLMYIELDTVLKETFGDTASREYLIKRASERGLSPYSASYAVLKGEFNMDVPIGARFSCSDLTYEAIEQVSAGVFKLQCETIGEVGNQNFGALIPVDYIAGLTTATLSSLIIPGEDEEDTEEFRTRYLASFDSQAFGGNKADYIEKTGALSGVGDVKVYPAWNGGGTVKVVILDSTSNAPTDTLVEYVQNELDPVGHGGTGVGLAPIGHVVSVEGADTVQIHVLSKFTFADGYTFATASNAVVTAVESYLLELRQSWANESGLVVRIEQIKSRLLNLPEIIDISDTLINLDDKNIVLEDNQVPVIGTVGEDSVIEV